MLAQERMIERVRQLCHEDSRVTAAFMYGSFIYGEGDAFSDIEFFIYIDDAYYPVFEAEQWLAGIAPLLLYFVNESGIGTAIFENLVRGEFHFEPASQMPVLRQYRGQVRFPEREAGATEGGQHHPDAMLLLDRTGELQEHLRFLSQHPPQPASADNIAGLIHNYLNWILFGSNVLARGEWARALEILSIIHRYLLWLARLDEGALTHWLTPSRKAEEDLPPQAYARFVVCTATLDEASLRQAYQAAWSWGRQLAAGLTSRHDLPWPEPLIARLDTHLATLERMNDA